MTIADCAEAGPARANAATDAAAKINLRMFPPAFLLRSALARCSGRCMPAAPIQRSRLECHCPLAGSVFSDFVAVQNATFCPLHHRHSGAMRKHRTTVRDCAPENLEIPGSRFA